MRGKEFSPGHDGHDGRPSDSLHASAPRPHARPAGHSTGGLGRDSEGWGPSDVGRGCSNGSHGQ